MSNLRRSQFSSRTLMSNMIRHFLEQWPLKTLIKEGHKV